ncbi:MAG: GNAT family N-acetyltransferase [Proteobacteria bacterium]|nr:GNAT family N-acetyltransferase [Pseudomonadota bacterium]
MTNEVSVHRDQAVGRLRSDGPLTGRLLDDHRSVGAELAFDPVQMGWVRSDVSDDFHPQTGRRPGWPQPVTSAARITLRPWNSAESEVFAALLDDPRLWEHMPQPYPGQITPDMADSLIALSNDGAFHHVRAIEVDGVAVGQVRLEYSDRGSELSYWIGRNHWRRGIAGRAVSRFLESAPVQGQLHARVRPGNVASLRLLERVGFRRQDIACDGSGWVILHR